MITLKETYYGFMSEKNNEISQGAKILSLEEVLEFYKLENAINISDPKYLGKSTRKIFGQRLGVKIAPSIGVSIDISKQYFFYRYDGTVESYVVSNNPSSISSHNDLTYFKNRYENFLEHVKFWYENIYIKQVQSRQNILNRYERLPVGPYGKVFAGDEREIPEEVPEKNTAEEKEIIAAVYRHIRTEPLDATIAHKIKNMLSKGMYKDLFLKPDTMEIYRGISVSKKEFERIVSGAQDKEQDIIKAKKPRKGIITPKKKVTYVPQSISGEKRGSSSWTTNIEVAKRFAISEDDPRREVYLVLVAKTNENPNKLFDLKKWYSEMDIATFAPEEETIGLGNIVIDKIMWQLK